MKENNSVAIVNAAKQSFEQVLSSDKYKSIIKDDRHLNLLMDMIEAKDEDRILDIGTGTGYLAFPLAEKYIDCKVCGIDIAEKIVEGNNKSANEFGLKNLKFISYDGIDFPFHWMSYEWMVTRYAIHHFPEIEKMLERLSEILCEGGHFLLSDPVRNINDKRRVIDRFMNVKQDGHVGFYLPSELEELFAYNDMYLEKKVMTKMKFPFPKKQKYIDIYNDLTDEEKEMYKVHIKDDIVWIGEIEVANMVFIKEGERTFEI